MMQTGEWQRVAASAELSEDTPLSVDFVGRAVGIFRLDGNVYAMEDVCPHAYALLSEGYVEGDSVECPLHAAVFQISTGKCLGGPVDRDLVTFEVKVEGDDIFVRQRTPA